MTRKVRICSDYIILLCGRSNFSLYDEVMSCYVGVLKFPASTPTPNAESDQEIDVQYLGREGNLLFSRPSNPKKSK